MRARFCGRAGAGLAVLLTSLGLSTVARAQSPLADTARLQGQFQLTGTVTVARHIRGERVGQAVARSWTFTPMCAVGPCEQIELTRQRAAGTDKLVLQLTSADNYAGSGQFYAPLRCAGRRVRRGEAVPFTIQVQITNAALSNGTPVATQLNASYTNRSRHNLTRCVAIPGHDAAVYQGSASGGQ